ncbi:MAG: IS66 family insertion sequence element accessory protein TnpB [Marinobacter sp.]|nr:IS66 family insertion sequence element accessory protein TnpB [Marinobacter sp.]
MRKSIEGLSLLVQEAMELNPFDEAVFLFCNRQRDKVNILAFSARSRGGTCASCIRYWA